MPSYEEIMDGTDLTKCTVQRHMRQLEMDMIQEAYVNGHADYQIPEDSEVE